MNNKLHHKYFFIIVFFGYFISCQNPSAVDEQLKYSVVCLLTTSNSSQQLFMYRTANLSEKENSSMNRYDNNYLWLPFFVENGSVKILEENLTVHNFNLKTDSLNQQDISKYYTAADTLIITPNSVYKLEATIDANTIVGSTKVPGDFSITHPLQGEVMTKKNSSSVEMNIHWSRSDRAFYYLLTVTFAGKNTIYNYQEYEHFYFSSRDTTFNSVIDFRMAKPESCFITVYAVDKNYYDHKFKGIDMSGLTGAYGYFGSAVGKSVSVRIQ